MFNATIKQRKRPFKAVGASSSSSSKGKSNDSASSGNGRNGDGDGDDDGRKGSGGSNIKSRNVNSPATTVEIDGVDVHFPFTPYDVQRAYMGKVLSALRNSQHALLESPTGTGKTLCLLCSALAWQRAEGGRIAAARESPMKAAARDAEVAVTGGSARPQLARGGGDDGSAAHAAVPQSPPSSSSSGGRAPVIIYASRTHSQLAQVVGELRNTRYRPRHAVLGGREHSCIHPRVNPTVARRTQSGGGGGNKDAGANEGKASSSDVNNGCSKLCKERKCMYRNNLEEKAGGKDRVWHPPSSSTAGVDPAPSGSVDYEQPVLDMEDLVALGREHKVCPFYHSRSLIRDAELLFVPYNYLFDRDARETSLADVDFANAVLIFDEAHNLEEFASESSSFELNSADVAGCVNEVQRALQYAEVNPELAGGAGNLRDNLLTLKSVLLKFEAYLTDGARTLSGRAGGGRGKNDEGASHPGEAIFDVFRDGAGITAANHVLFNGMARKVGEIIMEFKGGSVATSGTPRLDHFLNCLKRAFGSDKTSDLLAIARSKSYRVHVSKMAGDGHSGFKAGRTISYWCFAPALAMRELSFLKVRSILITSGTLAPLPSFSMELGLDFPVQLENRHVIQSDQIFVRVVGRGCSGKELSSKYGRRDDPEYIAELGSTLASLCRNIPGGVLVFFPSYGAMETAVEKWGGPASDRRQSGGGGKGAAFFAAKRKRPASKKYVFPMVPASFRASTGDSSSPWQRLLSRKSIVLEPRSTSDLSDAIAEYKRLLSTPKSPGAILMGVCRGKISEGIDFSDDMCRAVVVTGLPFAPYMDPKVKLKREFLDAARASAKARPSIDGGFGDEKWNVNKVKAAPQTLSGSEWYNQQAHRAVNQAIGRVIRHRHDYGAVLLLDHRFADVRNSDGLSKWLRPHVRDDSFGGTTRDLVKFFRQSESKTQQTKKQSLPVEPPKIEYKDGIREDALSKVKMVAHPKAEIGGSYVPPENIVGQYDLNDPSPPKSEVPESADRDFITSTASSLESASGLGALYSRGKVNVKSEPIASVARKETNTSSSFAGIESKPKGSSSIAFGFAKTAAIKRRTQPSRKSEAATRQAKIFFQKMQDGFSGEETTKVKKLLVAMRGFGDEKNDKEYVKTAKDLISFLVETNVDSKRVELMGMLFPLLPPKYRYKIEKMATILVFEKSPLRKMCRDVVPEDDFTVVKAFVMQMMFNGRCPGSSPDYTDRALLEDSQKIITIFHKHCINLQCLFDLLPPQALRRVRSLAIEMKKSQDAAKAKERDANFKGEQCVNASLFRSKPKPFVARASDKSEDPIDEESQKVLADAISHAKSLNSQTKERVLDFQRKNDSKVKPFNPYQRLALKDSTKRNLPSANTSDRTKRVRKEAGVNPDDDIDLCLRQANSDAFVKPKTKLEQINGKINAHVPKGYTCGICLGALKEPLMAECNHSACSGCWKTWLKKSNTCFSCRREDVTMKDLSKLVFTKATGTVPTLTQICNSNNSSGDEESDNEELEIVAS